MAEKKPEALEAHVKILRAIRPGDTVFLECLRMMTAEQMTSIHAQMKKLIPDVRVVILQAGVRVAGTQGTQQSPAGEKTA